MWKQFESHFRCSPFQNNITPCSNDMKRDSRSVPSTHSQKEITHRTVTSNDEVISEACLKRDGRGGYRQPQDSCFKGLTRPAPVLLASQRGRAEGRCQGLEWWVCAPQGGRENFIFSLIILDDMSPMVCEGKNREEHRKFSPWAKKIKEEAGWALSLYFFLRLKN